MGRAKSARDKRARTQRGRTPGGRRQGPNSQSRSTVPVPVAGGAGADTAGAGGTSAETAQAPDDSAPVSLPPERTPPIQHVRVDAPVDTGQASPPPSPGPSPAAVARLRVAEIDPWSVALTGALVSFGVGLALAVAACLSWVVTDAVDPGQPGPSLMWGLTLLSVTVLVGTVLGTAMATIIAFFYNLAAQYTGGVHFTLRRQAARRPGLVRLRAVLERDRRSSRLPVRLGVRRRPTA